MYSKAMVGRGRRARPDDLVRSMGSAPDEPPLCDPDPTRKRPSVVRALALVLVYRLPFYR